MGLSRYFLYTFFLLFCYNFSSAQVSNVIAVEEKCDLHIFYTSKDTIKAIGNYTCDALDIDSTIDAIWLLYSKSDTSFLFYQVSIKNHKKNGAEIWYMGKEYGGFYSYKSFLNGELHGPSIEFRPNGIKSIMNYLNGKKVGIGYYNDDYLHEEKFIYYDKKGYQKKTVNLFSKQR